MPERFVRDDVTRFFCGTCGTPVAYKAERFAGEIHFYMAALTKGNVAPTFHVHHAEAVDWMTITDELKRYPGSANAGMEGDSA